MASNTKKRFTLNWPIQLGQLGAVLAALADATSVDDQDVQLIGDSDHSRAIREMVSQVAPSTASVLITGESGTGKEVVARQIHQQSGRNGPFVAVNCGAIPDDLLESELFGHEKGAFTGAAARRIGRFEQAHTGTLFLDEIGDMPPAMQVKLLRVLQEHVVERIGGVKSIPVDVRIITATHRDLEQRISEGLFREDLFYRLNVVDIEIPPLRERPADVAPLADEMISRVSQKLDITISLSEDAAQMMENYAWPGNVRELGNVIERLAVSKPFGIIYPIDLPVEISGIEPVSAPDGGGLSVVSAANLELPEDGVDLKAHIATVERDLIADALKQADGVVAKAAKLLGVQRTTLVEKIKRYQL